MSQGSVLSLGASVTCYVETGLALVRSLPGIAWLVRALARWRNPRNPHPFTILGSFSVLQFMSQADGMLCYVVKDQRLRFEEEGVGEYPDEIEGDGRINSVHMYLWDLESDTLLDTAVKKSGTTQYRHLLRQRPTKGRIYRRVVMYTQTDGYPDTNEVFNLRVDHPLEQGRFTVLFPPGKPPKEVYVSVVGPTGARPMPRERPIVLPDGRTRFSFSLTAQPIGTRHEVRWIW